MSLAAPKKQVRESPVLLVLQLWPSYQSRENAAAQLLCEIRADVSPTSLAAMDRQL